MGPLSSTAAQRRALEGYLLVLRDRMRLQRWDIRVLADPPSDDPVLTIAPNSKRHAAAIRIGTFFSEDRQEQRHVCVHELLHLHQAGLYEWANDGEGWRAMHAAGMDWAAARIVAELEEQADAAARLIAPRMPLPPRWP